MGAAQWLERMLSMHKGPGSIPKYLYLKNKGKLREFVDSTLALKTLLQEIVQTEANDTRRKSGISGMKKEQKKW